MRDRSENLSGRLKGLPMPSPDMNLYNDILERGFQRFPERRTNYERALNAERKRFESAKQSKNISRSEFLPSITLSGDQVSTNTTNRTNQSGAELADSNLDSENKKISVEQKFFSGF